MAPPTTYASWHATHDVSPNLVKSEGDVEGGAIPSARYGGPPRGPARFYYDKATYTGTHRSGGPRIVDARAGLCVGGAHAETTPARSELASVPFAAGFAPFSQATTALRNQKRSPSPSENTNIRSSRQRPTSARGIVRPASARRAPSPRLGGAVTCTLSEDGAAPSPSLDMAQTMPAASSASSTRPASAGRKGRVETGRTGPERFFYDQSSYTGVHRFGGPSTIDSHGIGDISEILRPGLATHSANPFINSSPNPSQSQGLSTTLRTLDRSGTHREGSRPRSPSPAPHQGSYEECRRRPPLEEQGLKPPGVNPASDAPAARTGLRGPARFFYDQTTYTGVHRHGGPCTIESRGVTPGQLFRPEVRLGDRSDSWCRTNQRVAV